MVDVATVAFMPGIQEQLAMAAEEIARLARNVRVDQQRASTPCESYDVDELSTHLLQEVVLHGWDLAVATGQSPRFPEEIAGAVLRWLERGNEELENDAWYGARQATAASATALERALALSGRDPAAGHAAT